MQRISMEVPIIIYSVLLTAILAFNVTAHFVLRDATSEVQGEDAPAQQSSSQEKGGTPSFIAKGAEILVLGEQQLAVALPDAERQRAAAMIARWVDSALNQGIIKGEEAVQLVAWWRQRPEALKSGGNMVGRHSMQAPARLHGEKLTTGGRQ